MQDGCPSVLARGRHHSLLLLASVLLLSTVSRGLLVPGGSLLGSALPGKDEAGRQSEQGQRQRPPRSHPRHCAEYLARGPSLPLRGGGKNNNVLAKKVGAAGSAFISTKKKALFPASPQRLFITHTRVWRKCSICWVQPSAHTAYKLRAFTCRVPEIKHTHTHTSFGAAPALLPLPHCLCAPAPAGAGSRSGIPHYLRAFPASSAGNSSASVFLQPHLERVTPGCQPSGPGGWHALPPPPLSPCPPRRAAGPARPCLLL